MWGFSLFFNRLGGTSKEGLGIIGSPEEPKIGGNCHHCQQKFGHKNGVEFGVLPISIVIQNFFGFLNQARIFEKTMYRPDTKTRRAAGTALPGRGQGAGLWALPAW